MRRGLEHGEQRHNQLRRTLRAEADQHVGADRASAAFARGRWRDRSTRRRSTARPGRRGAVAWASPRPVAREGGDGSRGVFAPCVPLDEQPVRPSGASRVSCERARRARRRALKQRLEVRGEAGRRWLVEEVGVVLDVAAQARPLFEQREREVELGGLVLKAERARRKPPASISNCGRSGEDEHHLEERRVASVALGCNLRPVSRTARPGARKRRGTLPSPAAELPRSSGLPTGSSAAPSVDEEPESPSAPRGCARRRRATTTPIGTRNGRAGPASGERVRTASRHSRR